MVSWNGLLLSAGGRSREGPKIHLSREFTTTPAACKRQQSKQQTTSKHVDMRSVLALCCIIVVSMGINGVAYVPSNNVGVGNRILADRNVNTAKDLTSLKLAGRDDRPDDREVNVNLIPDVDAFTLTAVGFGLIAFNFLVLANVREYGTVCNARVRFSRFSCLLPMFCAFNVDGRHGRWWFRCKDHQRLF